MQRYSKSSEIQNKLVKIGYFDKKISEKFWRFQKKYYLCTRKTEQGCSERHFDFGVWCNGNTTDSGPVILGSSPSTPTEKIAKLFDIKHLAFFLFQLT